MSRRPPSHLRWADPPSRPGQRRAGAGPACSTRSDSPRTGKRSGVVGAAPGYRVRRRRGVVADPFVLPRLVILLRVATWPVDRDQFTGDLLAVRRPAARDLVGRDIDLPPVAGPAHPARRARMLEREALGGQVIALPYVTDRVPARPEVGIGPVQDGEDGRPGPRRPAGEQPWAFARLARRGAQPHPRAPASASFSLTASARTIPPSGSPALR